VRPETKSLGITKKHDLYNMYQRQFTGRNLTQDEWTSLPGNVGKKLGLNDFYSFLSRQPK
jgi:hypothetical protein